MTVKETLVTVVQEELKMDLFTACEYVQKWLNSFKNTGRKKEYVNIGRKRFLIE